MPETTKYEHEISVSDHISPMPSVQKTALHVVLFGNSVVSDLDNPVATTTRAMLQVLAQLGHHAVYLEPRGNQPTINLLRAHGSGAVRSFSKVFPEIHYRTYDLPTNRDRYIWFGRELSVADVVIVQDTAPKEIFELLQQGTAPHIVRIVQQTQSGIPDIASDLLITPIGIGTGLNVGPAVLANKNSTPTHRADNLLIVTYGERNRAIAFADLLAPFKPDLITVGSEIDLPFVPEVELQNRYSLYSAVLVIDVGTSPLAASRALLATAAGCKTFVAGTFPTNFAPEIFHLTSVNTSTAIHKISTALSGMNPIASESLPPAFDALGQTQQLLAEIYRLKTIKQMKTNGGHNSN